MPKDKKHPSVEPRGLVVAAYDALDDLVIVSEPSDSLGDWMTVVEIRRRLETMAGMLYGKEVRLARLEIALDGK